MVFVGNGLSYSEMKRMDLAEFSEAVAARELWQEEWSKPPMTGSQAR